MDIDQLTEQEIDELVGKAQAHYRQEIRPLVYPKHKGRMLVIDLDPVVWTTRSTPAYRLPSNGCRIGVLEQFRSSTKSATNPPAEL